MYSQLFASIVFTITTGNPKKILGILKEKGKLVALVIVAALVQLFPRTSQTYTSYGAVPLILDISIIWSIGFIYKYDTRYNFSSILKERKIKV